MHPVWSPTTWHSPPLSAVGHAEIARAQHPDRATQILSLMIFQNRADPAGDVLLEVVVLPTQKAGVRADPERSVRRTKQGHDGGVE